MRLLSKNSKECYKSFTSTPFLIQDAKKNTIEEHNDVLSQLREEVRTITQIVEWSLHNDKNLLEDLDNYSGYSNASKIGIALGLTLPQGVIQHQRDDYHQYTAGIISEQEYLRKISKNSGNSRREWLYHRRLIDEASSWSERIKTANGSSDKYISQGWKRTINTSSPYNIKDKISLSITDKQYAKIMNDPFDDGVIILKLVINGAWYYLYFKFDNTRFAGGDKVCLPDITINDKDVVCVTESLVARAQGNYASIEQIAKDINNKFDGDELVVLFPILSRNRFSILLKAIALSGKKLHICLSYPQDEVGNYLMDEMDLFNSNINPYQDVLDIDQFRKIAGEYRHTFTGMDYPALYTELAPNSEIHFLNNPVDSLKFADEVLVCSIHTRNIIKRQLKEAGGKNILSLDEILNEPVEGSGFNKDYGLLGSNLSTEGEVKLFPRDGEDFVANLQKKLVNHFDKQIEVMIYGDGAFKDPVGKIWELADPIVSPAFTKGLSGTPSELKIKYIADNEFSDLSIEERTSAMVDRISKKEKELVGKNETLGTTPRQITDLLGSLADLTSGSGDKGTPIVLIQGYFDNYSNN